jgi:hypothetical protein
MFLRQLCLVTALALLGAASVASAAPPVTTETSRDVGFGFREVLRDEPNPPGAFEAVGHFRFLYYRDQQLSQFDIYSIAPTGRYAVFQDGPSGDIVLFVTKSRNRRVLRKYPGALVTRLTWEHGEHAVILEFGSKAKPIRASVE